MITLFINTAASDTTVAVLEDKKLIYKDSWLATHNEASTLLPKIKDQLGQKIDEIVVVKGPGSFTSVRIGVTIANTLSYATSAALYEVDYFTLLESSLSEESGTIVVKAGKNEVYIKQKGDPLEETLLTKFDSSILDHIKGLAWGDLTVEQNKELQSWLSETDKQWIDSSNYLALGEILAKINTNKVQMVKPLYIKNPNISQPKKQ